MFVYTTMPLIKQPLSLREQWIRDHAKRRKNLQEIRNEETRKITALKLKVLLIVDKFRKMYSENPSISPMLIQYFSSYKGIDAKDIFVNDLLQGNVMVITNLGKDQLKEFLNDFN